MDNKQERYDKLVKRIHDCNCCNAIKKPMFCKDGVCLINVPEKYKNKMSVYSYGFSVVQLDNGMWGYRDTNGNLSETYKYKIEPYFFGFGVVRLENGKYAYRDVNGNLSEEYTRAIDYNEGFGEVLLDNGERAYRDETGNIFCGIEYENIRKRLKG